MALWGKRAREGEGRLVVCVCGLLGLGVARYDSRDGVHSHSWSAGFGERGMGLGMG